MVERGTKLYDFQNNNQLIHFHQYDLIKYNLNRIVCDLVGTKFCIFFWFCSFCIDATVEWIPLCHIAWVAPLCLLFLSLFVLMLTQTHTHTHRNINWTSNFQGRTDLLWILSHSAAIEFHDKSIRGGCWIKTSGLHLYQICHLQGIHGTKKECRTSKQSNFFRFF